MPDEMLPQFVIDRREAIRRVSAMLGGAALIGGTSLMAACSREPAVTADSATAAAPAPEPPLTMFSAEEVAYLDEIAETILPATSTPGAKDARCGRFIGVMVQDCYTKEDQEIFRRGMTTLNDACTKAHGHGFMQATSEERLALLTDIDKQAKDYQDKKKGDDPNHYFRMMKELTLLGFFTSEVGMTKVLRYAETPGRFDPCAPYAKGETIWANHA